jgi:superfamily II DNA or RNA helicase
VTSQTLRAWQQEAFGHYSRTQPRNFLAVATPGSGKTTFALTIAADLLYRRVVDQVVVVAPTEHLKVQWAEAAHRVGIALDPNLQGRLSPDFQGYVVTYAGLAVNPVAHRARIERIRTFVILDEIHHAGDAMSWGEAVREACEPAERRLALTGTPFRSDDNPIPFVTYAPQPDGSVSSVADYNYNYGRALADVWWCVPCCSWHFLGRCNGVRELVMKSPRVWVSHSPKT